MFQNGWPKRVLLVHAHPDDESIYTGATIAHLIAHGADIYVVTCTRGEVGDILDPQYSNYGNDQDDKLGDLRTHEISLALGVLGVNRHRFLGAPNKQWRDSGMSGNVTNLHPRSFIKGEIEEQTEELKALIEDYHPDLVITYDPNGGYGHPDHIRAHRITSLAVKEMAPSPLLYWCLIPAPVPSRNLDFIESSANKYEIAIEPYLSTKIAALKSHRSQLGADFVDHLTNEEIKNMIPAYELLVSADLKVRD